MKYAIVRILVSQIHIYYINRLVLLLSYISLLQPNLRATVYIDTFGFMAQFKILYCIIKCPTCFDMNNTQLLQSTLLLNRRTKSLFNKVATSIKQKKLENIQTMKHLVFCVLSFNWLAFFHSFCLSVFVQVSLPPFFICYFLLWLFGVFLGVRGGGQLKNVLTKNYCIQSQDDYVK